tara:strand:- start:2529 stop:2636 length:108 start_codon:yes stop_codon:yes gene_type:complete
MLHRQMLTGVGGAEGPEIRDLTAVGVGDGPSVTPI